MSSLSLLKCESMSLMTKPTVQDTLCYIGEECPRPYATRKCNYLHELQRGKVRVLVWLQSYIEEGIPYYELGFTKELARKGGVSKQIMRAPRHLPDLSRVSHDTR